MTAAQAIDRSESHDEIVTMPRSPAAEQDLLAACDYSVLNGAVHEFWGTETDAETGDSVTWRIHLYR